MAPQRGFQGRRGEVVEEAKQGAILPLRCARVMACLLTAIVQATAAAAQGPTPFPRPAGTSFRVLSWNVSRSGFVEHRDAFRALVRLADPDLLILDEVDEAHTPDDLRAGLHGIRGPADTVWYATIGLGGGYQRGAVVSRGLVEVVDELDRVAYPDTGVGLVLALAPDSIRERLRRSFARGVPVHGAVLRVGGRRLLAVSLDLQCCGVAGSWEEERRVLEARLVRAALQQALRRVSVDGVVAAGDLNLVGTAIPLVVLLGPYDPPHYALLPAEAHHRDGRAMWTWDGRGTEFPSRPLDFQLHSQRSLDRVAAVVLDSKDLGPPELAAFGIDAGASRRVSDHLPVVVDYRWR